MRIFIVFACLTFSLQSFACLYKAKSLSEFKQIEHDEDEIQEMNKEVEDCYDNGNDLYIFDNDTYSKTVEIWNYISKNYGDTYESDDFFDRRTFHIVEIGYMFSESIAKWKLGEADKLNKEITKELEGK